MKKILTVSVVTILLNLMLYAQVWINEISYDMTGADTDDFIEIVAPTGTDMSIYGILLANGNGDVSYGYTQLSGTISSTNANNGFGFFLLLSNESSSITPPAGITYLTVTGSGFGSGIQNGSPDGILLLNHSTGATIHGIWYEETDTPPSSITRNSTGSPPGTGPYSMTGVDVESLGESDVSDVGMSLSMSGSGKSGVWEVPTSGTPGSMNTGQTSLPVELVKFTFLLKGNEVHLKWITKTEVNNYGFEIEKCLTQSLSQGKGVNGWEKIGFVPGAGNSNSPRNYSFADKNIVSYGKISYRLKQLDSDGKFEYSKTVEVDFGSVKDFALFQNYPNPFNPSTFISYSIPQAVHVKLSVFNVLGSEIVTLVHEFQEAGYYSKEFSIDQNGLNLTNGVYFYKLEVGNFTATKKFILMK